MLTQSLSVLLELWRGRSHLGPVIAKSSMVIAVAIAVTVNLYTDFDGIFEKGVEAADQLITEMTDLSAAGSSAGSQTTTPDFGCNTDLFGLDFSPNMTLPFAMTSSFDANPALMGDFDSTFMDFSGDTVVNIF
ncbi:hypothetical protein SEUCBS140593_008531 [Sporothrix eucalyptigena]|uniref:Uncharacterized protein n=1 Tax=Sporothrix eucalyptigena TaxID=1812306 RepID=A0ABP0CM95_9PEZI